MTEVLIVGGLTVDRFVDGSLAPGGSVLHSGLAAASDGAALTMLTVAGDEPAARDGLARLASIGELVHQPAGSTTVYRHEERDGVRVLVLEARTDPIRPEGPARDRAPARGPRRADRGRGTGRSSSSAWSRTSRHRQAGPADPGMAPTAGDRRRGASAAA